MSLSTGLGRSIMSAMTRSHPNKRTFTRALAQRISLIYISFNPFMLACPFLPTMM